MLLFIQCKNSHLNDGLELEEFLMAQATYIKSTKSIKSTWDFKCFVTFVGLYSQFQTSISSEGMKDGSK